jgi:hypothetical protein
VKKTSLEVVENGRLDGVRKYVKKTPLEVIENGRLDGLRKYVKKTSLEVGENKTRWGEQVCEEDIA